MSILQSTSVPPKQEASSLYTYIIFTDGSCKGNHTKNYVSRKGGWAFVILDDNYKTLEKGSGPLKSENPQNITNNAAELTAVVKALERLDEMKKLTQKPYIQIVTDSNYVKDGITNYIKTWKKNDWKRVEKGKKVEVKNLSLWLRLDSACKNNFIDWKWTKAHVTKLDQIESEMNGLVDRMAQSAADKQ
jgi:ribonuclease HI